MINTVYVVKKIVHDDIEGFFFYTEKPKRLKVHCTYDKVEFTDLICSLDPYGCYDDRVEKMLLTRKAFIAFNKQGQMVFKKYNPHYINTYNLSKEMGRLFLPH